MAYIIGVDAGGTSTKAIAYTTTGDELGRFKGGSANPAAAGLRQAALNLEHVIEQCRKQCGNEIDYMLVGAAGVETGQLKPQLLSLLRERHPEVTIDLISDALLVLEARLEDRDGVALIAGTGSVAWGKHGSRTHRVGGWGHLIGDLGSGYAIAMQAIREMAACIDSGQPLIPLGEKILDHLQIQSWREMVDFVYQSDKAGIASLLPMLEQAAIEGDQTAVSLFNEAVTHLCQMTCLCANVLEISGPHVAASGSVLQRIPIVQKTFSRQMERQLPGSVVDYEQIEANRAVLYRYRKMK